MCHGMRAANICLQERPGTTLAISKDDGTHWFFIEASPASRKYFEAKMPDLWERLSIPDAKLVPQ